MSDEQSAESDRSWMGGNRGLSREELAAFLSRPWVCRLATVQPSGAPYVVPVWYEYDPATQHLAIVARERSAYVAHIKHEPRVSISVADDATGHMRALIEGRADILEGPTTTGRWVEIGRRMAARYLGEQRGPEYLESTLTRPRYLIRVTPEKIRTWQGTEWHPSYYR